MDTSHFITSRSIRKKKAEKLLSGEELTMEDRESIAFELCCENYEERTFRRICEKLWLQSKPKTVKLTIEERELLTEVFPRNKRGRKATGAGDSTILVSLWYSHFRNQYSTNIETYQAVAKTMLAIGGGSVSIDTLVKRKQRGDEALAAMPDIDYDAAKPQITLEKIEALQSKGVLRDYFKPSLLEELDLI